MAEHSNLRDNSARLRRNMSKLAFRSKEKVMRSIGRAEETKDEILDHYVMLINKQQMQMQKLQRDMKWYLAALKAMSVSQKAFYDSLYEIYDDDWAGKDVIASCSQRNQMLHDDIFARFQAEVTDVLQNHLAEYLDCKLKVEKRGRKLVDYDAARRSLHSLESSKKPDPVKVERATEHVQQAKESYETLNNHLHDRLPTLYDSRLPICVKTFSSICESERLFSNEVAEMNTKLKNVFSSLNTAFEKGEYHIQRMPPPLDNGRVAPTSSSGSTRTNTESPAKSVAPSQQSPSKSNDEDDDALPSSPASDPSTHEYVNLQVGPISGAVQPVTEEEESGLQKDIDKRKRRPMSMYAPAASNEFSVVEIEEGKSKDDGSGSTSAKTASPPVEKSSNQEAKSTQDETKPRKGLFGFIGFKKKSVKRPSNMSAATPPNSPAGTEEKKDESQKVEKVTEEPKFEMAKKTAEAQPDVSAAATAAMKEKAESVEDEHATREPDIEQTNAAKNEDGQNEDEIQDNDSTVQTNTAERFETESQPKEAAGDSGDHVSNQDFPPPPSPELRSSDEIDDVDAAFAQHKKSKDPSIQTGDMAEGQKDQAAIEKTQETNSVSDKEGDNEQPIEVKASLQNLPVENDPVFSVAIDGSNVAAPSNFEIPPSDFEDPNAFGDVSATVHSPDSINEAFSASLDEPSKEFADSGFEGKDMFGSEPFECVIEDPDDAKTTVDPFSESGKVAYESPMKEKFDENLDEVFSHPEPKSFQNTIHDLNETSTQQESVFGQKEFGATNEGGNFTEAQESVKVVQQIPIIEADNSEIVINEEKKLQGANDDAIVGNLYMNLQEMENNVSSKNKEDMAKTTQKNEMQTPEEVVQSPDSALDVGAYSPVSFGTDSPSQDSKSHFDEPPRPLTVDLSDDDDDESDDEIVMAESVLEVKDQNGNTKTEKVEEYSKQETMTANGDHISAQPIYEEPPNEEDLPSFQKELKEKQPKPKSPTKSVDSHKYLDLPPNYLFSVQALYQYKSTDDDELSFDKGEVVHIIKHPDPEEQDDGWQMGVRQKEWEEKGGASCMGVFPENFTKPIQL